MKAKSLTAAFSLLIPLIGATTSLAQNPDTAGSKQAVAIIAKQPVTEGDLAPFIQAQLLPLRKQEYEIKKRALDNLIEQKLLEAEAKKKGVSTETLLQQEVDAKIPEPTSPELEGYYLGQKERWNRPFDEVKDQLRQALKQAKVQQSRQDYLKGLRAAGDVVVLLAPPRIKVAIDPTRVRGNAQAPVTIVEFSDFQCPYCRQMEPVLVDLLAKYRDNVSLAYRDFPLATVHAQAELAAEASRCASEQGKFWQYHDHLYSASNLERPALIAYARELKLEEKQFDSCLASEKYKAQVQRDFQEGTQAGVSGTPAFFVNGIPFAGAQTEETFVRAIEDELARKR